MLSIDAMNVLVADAIAGRSASVGGDYGRKFHESVKRELADAPTGSVVSVGSEVAFDADEDAAYLAQAEEAFSAVDIVTLRKSLMDGVWLRNCGIGPGGFQPGNTCAAGGGVKLDGSVAIWESPTREQLDRAGAVFKELSEGDVSTYIDRQMRGGVLSKKGVFTEFDEKKKASNLAKIESGLAVIRDQDPEAFEAARQWSVAEALQGRSGVNKYSEVPDVVTVYRGHDADEVLPRRTNVTHIKEVAEKFGASGAVSEYQIHKKDIGFTLHGSVFAEGELLVFSKKSLKKVGTKVSDEAIERKKAKEKIAGYNPGDEVKFKDGTSGKVLGHGTVGGLIVDRGNGFIDYAVSVGDLD